MARMQTISASHELPANTVAQVLVLTRGLTREQLAMVTQASGTCGAVCHPIDHIDDFRNNSPLYCNVAIIALHPSPSSDALAALSKAREVCPSVIAIAADDAAASVGEKCRALLSGASSVLDARDHALDAALTSTLSELLAKQQRQHEDERRILNVASAHGIVGESPALLGAVRQLVRVSTLSDLPVLINGESGTGKELFAAALHALDPKRCGRELIAVNCAAINSGVADSQLFGHVRGAFTGANQDHGGWFAAAHGSVLFLDEIGELSLDIQAKILRVLQERKVQRVGGSKESKIDVRVVAATNRDLPKMIAEGRFREDLYHRLNTLHIRIPPLRERGGDLALLVNHFLTEVQEPTRIASADGEVISALSSLRLPGNVRELRNLIITVLAAKTDNAPLGLRDLPMDVWRELSATQAGTPAANDPLPVAPITFSEDSVRCWNLDKLLAQHERQILTAALREANNNQSRAAALLGITPRSVYNKLRKHALLAQRTE